MPAPAMGLAPRMVPDALKLETKLKKLESSDNPEGALVPGGTPALVWPDTIRATSTCGASSSPRGQVGISNKPVLDK